MEDTDVEDTDVEDTDVEDTDVEDTDVEDTDVEDTDVEDTDVEDTDMGAIDDDETDFDLEDADEDDFTIDDDIETEENEENADDEIEEDAAENICNEEVDGNADAFVIDAGVEEITTADGTVNNKEASTDVTVTVTATAGQSIVINNAVWKITCTENRQYVIDDTDITQLLDVLNIKGLQTYSESAFTYITRTGDSLNNINTDLVSVQQPANSKIRFADFVFTNCVNLCKFVSGVELNEIPVGLFTNCVRLYVLEIPTSLKVVNDFAFKDCKSLDCSELIKTNALQRIGVCAFASTNTTEVTLPTSLKDLDAMAFSGCGNLSVVNLTSTIATQWGNNLITYSKNSNTDDIMEKVQKSKAYVFAQCRNLQKVNLSKADILAIAKMQFVGTPYDKC